MCRICRFGPVTASFCFDSIVTPSHCTALHEWLLCCFIATRDLYLTSAALTSTRAAKNHNRNSSETTTRHSSGLRRSGHGSIYSATTSTVQHLQYLSITTTVRSTTARAYEHHPSPTQSPCNPQPVLNLTPSDYTIKMKRNLVIFLIVIILFIVLALIGFAIYGVQHGFSRRRGGASSTSGDDA